MREAWLLAVLLVLSTCSTTSTGTGDLVTLSIQVSGDGAGSVHSTPLGIACGEICSVQFPRGTPVEVRAEAKAGSIVGAWEGCPSERGSLCQLTLSQDSQLGMRFDLNPEPPVELVSLLVERQGSGRVTSAPIGSLSCGDQCRIEIPRGSTVQLTAAADPGHYFAGWGGACRGAQRTCEVDARGATQVIALFSPQVCMHRNFCWENPIPTGRPSLAVYAFSDDDAWLVTEDREGSLVRWNGIGWMAQPDSQIVGPLRPALRRLWASGHSDVWGSDGQRLWHFDGAVFQVQPLPGAAAIYNVHGRSASDVWAVGPSGASFHFNGTTWSAVPTGVTANLTGVWVAPDGTAWASGASGTMLFWDGSRWNPVTTPVTVGIGTLAGSDTNDIWAITGAGMMHFDGTTWSLVPSAPSLNGIQVVGRNDVWGHNRAQVHHFDGTGWLTYSSPRVQSIAATRSQVWAIEEDTGQIFHREGLSFVPHYPNIRLRRTPSAQRLSQVWMSDPKNAWAVGDAGVLLHYDSGAWTRQDIGTTEDLVAIHGSAHDDIWLASAKRLWHYNGTSWTQQADPALKSYDSILELFSAPGGRLWLFTSGEGVYQRTEAGTLLQQFAGTVSSRPFYGCLFSVGTTEPWLVRRQGMYRWTGATWQQQTLSPGGEYSCAGGLSQTDIWVSSLLGYDWYHYNGTNVDQVLRTSLSDDPVSRVLPLAADNIWAIGRGWFDLGHYDGKTWQQEPLSLTIHGGASIGQHVLLVGNFGNILRYRP